MSFPPAARYGSGRVTVPRINHPLFDQFKVAGGWWAGPYIMVPFRQRGIANNAVFTLDYMSDANIGLALMQTMAVTADNAPLRAVEVSSISIGTHEEYMLGGNSAPGDVVLGTGYQLTRGVWQPQEWQPSFVCDPANRLAITATNNSGGPLDIDGCHEGRSIVTRDHWYPRAINGRPLIYGQPGRVSREVPVPNVAGGGEAQIRIETTERYGLAFYGVCIFIDTEDAPPATFLSDIEVRGIQFNDRESLMYRNAGAQAIRATAYSGMRSPSAAAGDGVMRWHMFPVPIIVPPNYTLTLLLGNTSATERVVRTVWLSQMIIDPTKP